MDSQTFYDLIGHYGLYAVFFLAMIEGDITLLLAGVLAHSGFFGEYSYLKVFTAGTVGGAVSDNIAYFVGRGFRQGVSGFKFYRAAQPRLERLTHKVGPLAIFLSKFIYGLRTATCVFYGVGRLRFSRFLPLAFLSCGVWVAVLSSAGFFFSGAVIRVIGDFHQLGFLLLVIVIVGITFFYLFERLYISKKVEESSPELIHEFELAAQEKLHEFSQDFHERMQQKKQNQLPRNKRSTRRAKAAAKRKAANNERI
jgi:membrane protein DedA with SNARE-associated domain